MRLTRAPDPPWDDIRELQAAYRTFGSDDLEVKVGSSILEPA